MGDNLGTGEKSTGAFESLAEARCLGPGVGRRLCGNVTAELPVVLLVLFIFLAFPMLNLATSSVRAYFLRSAVLQAAHNAAKACTFATNVPAQEGEPPCSSALSIANKTLDDFAGSFKGVAITNREISIVVQNIASGSESSSTSPLSTVDPEKNLYYLEVSVDGEAMPLIPMTGTMVPQVPGLTSAMKLKLSGREIFEQTEGLTQ
ncbi:MAG TPA: hypothetical protein V6D08_10480 [Candidatus Obscuribacterales bacterium]